MRLCITILGIACLLSSSNQARAETCYASPQGGGNGLSRESPFIVAQFWNDAQAGDTLILLDGVYKGAKSMINPPKGLSGTEAAPITIRAMNDGRVTMNGESKHNPIRLYHNDWFVVEGLNAHNSKSTVVEVSGSNHCIIRRVCAWDAADGNTNIFAAHYGDYNLFEDCAGWGTARKTYSCSQNGNYTIFRRCFGIWEGCHAVGPKMTFTLFYNSHHIIAENCIATWDGRLMRESHAAMGYDGEPFTNWGDGSGKPRYYTNYGVDQPSGCFSRDRIDRGLTKGPFIYGCVAYRLKSQRVVPISGLLTISCLQPGDGWIENCAALVEEGADAVRPFNLTRVDGHNLTAIGGSESSIKMGEITNVLAAVDDAGRTAWNKMLQKDPPENGAHIYYRYENGKLTDKPLWPWPMNDRIKELKGVDVTATIFDLGEPHTDT